MIRRMLGGWQIKGDASHVLVSGSLKTPIFSRGHYTCDIRGPSVYTALTQLDHEHGSDVFNVRGYGGQQDVSMCVINLTEPT